MKAEVQPTLNPLSNIFLNLPAKQSAPSTQASASRLPAGAKTIGNYLLGKNIGQGTFGKVHLALHLPTSEKVAVKIIDKARMRPKDVQRVQSEIEVLTRIRHRNVVTLYEIIETEKSLLLVTEFLPNGELFRHIIKERRLPEDEACAYFQQIIEAVDYLHRNKIAHRDLKPENILIDYDRQLKLIDFGLSALYKGRERLDTFCGSPCYAAPEMVEAKQKYSPLQVDLWSCGVILFAMLCGHLPFCDADTHTLFKKILACNYRIPSHVSPEAQDLIQRLLVLDPQDRISLEDIREHRWFNRVPPAAAYGLDFGEQLPADPGVLQRLKGMGVSEQRMREEVLANRKSKDMATYLILMKKLVKNGQLIPSYIGNDNFNPKLIIREEKMPDEQDTESYNGPDSDHVFIKAPDAPEMPEFPTDVGPLVGSPEYLTDEEVKEMDESELMLLAGSILDLFLPKALELKPSISQISEVLSKTDRNPIARLTLDKREDEFYSHNKAIAKRQLCLSQVHAFGKKMPKLLDSSTVGTIYRYQIKSSMARVKATARHNRSITKRDSMEPRRPAQNRLNSEKTVDSTIGQSHKRTVTVESAQLQKKNSFILPSLHHRVEILKAESKASFFNKRYKHFKNHLH